MGYEIARKLIEDTFRSGMPQGTAIRFGNTAYKAPEEGYLWLHILGGGSGLMGAANIEQRRHVGIIEVQIFVPADSGNSDQGKRADEIEAAIAHKQLAKDTTQVTTRGPTFQPVGKVGDWHQTNVTIPFTRDELAVA